MDYNTADPLIRWDSYENMSADGEGACGWGERACPQLPQQSPAAVAYSVTVTLNPTVQRLYVSDTVGFEGTHKGQTGEFRSGPL